MSKVTLAIISVCMLLGLLIHQPSRRNPFLSGGRNKDSIKVLKSLQGLTGDGEGQKGLSTLMDLIQRSVVDGEPGANFAGALTGSAKPGDIPQAHKALMIQQILGDVERQLEAAPEAGSKVAVAKLLSGLLALDCGLAKHADEEEASQCKKDGTCHVV